MNKNRKSIFIFLVIVIGITFGWEIGVYKAGVDYGSVKYNALMVGMMWFPAVSAYLTKWICREKIRFGLKSDMNLLPSFNQKKGKYYVYAVAAPFICVLAANLLIYIRYPQKFDFNGISKQSIIVDILISLGVGIIYAVLYALGEEIGWRGFLMPRLEREMPKSVMLVVSGVIWGLWHAPLIYQGHLFGLKYKAAPWGGLAVMCVFCVLIGAWFYYLYIRSESIWVCALAHSFNNICSGYLALLGVKGEYAEEMIQEFGITCTLLVPAMVLGAWAFWKLCRINKNE